MNAALTFTHLGILAVSTLGFLALALATERHAEHLLGRLPASQWRHVSRGVGWLLLALSLGWAITDLGAGIGITLWLGWLSVAALMLVFTFPKWPRKPTVSAKPVRKAKAAAPDASPPVAAFRIHPKVAVGLLFATVAVFCTALARVETQPLNRADAIQGQAGPWRFTLAETRQEPPEVMEMDTPMKAFRLRFCETCDAEIQQVALKVHKPRSARAMGMAFMGNRWERRVEIPLPSTTGADSELWLTVVGKDGSVHQAAMPMRQVSIATVRWFEQRRTAYAPQ